MARVGPANAGTGAGEANTQSSSHTLKGSACAPASPSASREYFSANSNLPRATSVIAKCATYTCRVRHADTPAVPPAPAAPALAEEALPTSANAAPAVATSSNGANATLKIVNSNPNRSPLAESRLPVTYHHS